jgi:hypothetical protein
MLQFHHVNRTCSLIFLSFQMSSHVDCECATCKPKPQQWISLVVYDGFQPF